MRYALIASSFFVALAVGSYACSSSDTTTPAPDAGKVTTPPKGDDDDVGTSSSSSSSSTSSSSSSTGGPGDGGNTSSSGNADSGTPIDGGAAGTLCTTGSTQETAGSTMGSPILVPTTTGTAVAAFCGRISAGGEADYFQYTFNVTGGGSFSVTPTATNGVTVTGTVNGTDFTLSGSIPFKPGMPYLFKVTNAAASDYRVTISVTQN